ncbi:MAG TPA: NAD(P)/FAD-dependent oxidoreductase [Hyphomonadaceae bacterium]|nr:NAD(P)/FAD-dependent oxidoreductase [Hyphomonadaceae bacterium]
MADSVGILVIGGGAAGIGAAQRLAEAHADYLLVEARPRLGGRAWTVQDEHAIDLGCGWLHSADENPWTRIAQDLGWRIDKTPPPWMRSSGIDMDKEEAADLRKTMNEFYEKLEQSAARPDAAASTLLPENGRWTALMNAICTYVNGAELDRVSIHDYAAYHDSGVNWRVADGYGAMITSTASELKTMLECPVTGIDHSGARIHVATRLGVITADKVIVTVSSAILAEERIQFTPALPDKTEAAQGLPLGLADKLYLSLEDAEEFETDSRLFGHPREAATAAYHMRPFGRPLIEVYFGGRLADDLESQGGRAFVDFATWELTSQLGSDFARRIKPVRLSQWRGDEFARGSYSYASPGCHGNRAKLAAPVDNRLFFAGEACSPRHYSTAHGAYLTGLAAAEKALAG